jgi:hypothetical protein
MMRRGGRLYWRSVRQRERSLAARPAAPNDWFGEQDYDRHEIMAKIDSLPLGWRMLINEYGFTPVMKARSWSTDIRTIEKMMKQRHDHRQQQLAEGRA